MLSGQTTLLDFLSLGLLKFHFKLKGYLSRAVIDIHKCSALKPVRFQTSDQGGGAHNFEKLKQNKKKKTDLMMM